ncbi:MAG: hypothetical protein J5984_03765, partial [Clostridia bacterium]|nr:hypothetical protein [Clostridia bacterium]
MKYAELLKKFKGKNLIYLLILTAVLLLLFSGGKVTENKNSEIVKQENNYYEEISVRLENILSKIRGAGDVSVMFILENNGEVIPVFNNKTS